MEPDIILRIHLSDDWRVQHLLCSSQTYHDIMIEGMSTIFQHLFCSSQTYHDIIIEGMSTFFTGMLKLTTEQANTRIAGVHMQILYRRPFLESLDANQQIGCFPQKLLLLFNDPAFMDLRFVVLCMDVVGIEEKMPDPSQLKKGKSDDEDEDSDQENDDTDIDESDHPMESCASNNYCTMNLDFCSTADSKGHQSANVPLGNGAQTLSYVTKLALMECLEKEFPALKRMRLTGLIVRMQTVYIDRLTLEEDGSVLQFCSTVNESNLKAGVVIKAMLSKSSVDFLTSDVVKVLITYGKTIESLDTLRNLIGLKDGWIVAAIKRYRRIERRAWNVIIRVLDVSTNAVCREILDAMPVIMAGIQDAVDCLLKLNPTPQSGIYMYHNVERLQEVSVKLDNLVEREGSVFYAVDKKDMGSLQSELLELITNQSSRDSKPVEAMIHSSAALGTQPVLGFSQESELVAEAATERNYRFDPQWSQSLSDSIAPFPTVENVYFRTGKGREDVNSAEEITAEDTASELFHRGWEEVIKDDHKAFELWKKSADMGNSNAITNLGVCYQRGVGTPKDEVKARKLYLEAAEQGQPIAQFNCGVCYFHGIGVDSPDRKRAAHFWNLAAKQNHAPSQHELSLLEKDSIVAGLEMLKLDPKEGEKVRSWVA